MHKRRTPRRMSSHGRCLPHRSCLRFQGEILSLPPRRVPCANDMRARRTSDRAVPDGRNSNCVAQAPRLLQPVMWRCAAHSNGTGELHGPVRPAMQPQCSTQQPIALRPQAAPPRPAPSEPPSQQPSAHQLSDAELRGISEQWSRFWGPITPVDRNRILARRMKEASQGDPWALDIAKQDGKEFVTGMISAAELRDRFVGIFSMAGPETCEELYKEMTMLVPQPARRAQLLALCKDPWLLPRYVPEPLVPPVDLAKQADQGVGRSSRAQAAAAAAVPTAQGSRAPVTVAAQASPAAKDAGTVAQAMRDGVEVEEGEDGEGEEGEYEDEEEDEEGEDDDMLYADEQEEDYEGEEDVKDFRGWQVLDRSRIQTMAQQIIDKGGLPDLGVQPGSEASTSGRPAVAVVGSAATTESGQNLELFSVAGSHFNSMSSRPARKLAGKKASKAKATGSKGQAPPGAKNVIVWLRQDLRIHDNPALCEAVRTANLLGGMVTLMYVHSPQEDGDAPASGTSWRPSGASLLWLQLALDTLNHDLVQRYGQGAGIVFKQGPYAEAIRQVAAAVGAWHIFFNRRYEPAMMASDSQVESALATSGFEVRSFNALLLREPWEVKIDMTSFSGHFGSLMPFCHAMERLGRVPDPLKEPKKLPVANEHPAETCGGLALEDLGLYRPPIGPDGSPVDWAAPIRSAWRAGETQAVQLLESFLSQGLQHYEAERGYADGRAVSRLSPYLHLGQLSPRLMWQRLQVVGAKSISKTFYRRLIWRELAYWQLHHWPTMSSEPIRTAYMDQEWSTGPEADAQLRAWQRGLTGFPMVDAGMRELWQTGWMHQDVRMVAACFLTEYLSIPWVEGAKWFHDTLLDADLAVNSMMWQNAGKSGLDQWQYTMEPTSKLQDPSGDYIRKWVPELSKIPTEHIHTPWQAPAEVLQAAGVVLGQTYPDRIIGPGTSLEELRERNTKAILAAKALHAVEWSDARGFDTVIAPKGSTTNLDGTKVVVFTKPEYRQKVGAATTSGVSELQGEGIDESAAALERKAAADAKPAKKIFQGRPRALAAARAGKGGRNGWQKKANAPRGFAKADADPAW